MDKLLADALLETLAKGIVPAPDRSISTKATISQKPPLMLQFGSDGQFTRDDVTGNYKLKCQHLKNNMMLGVLSFLLSLLVHLLVYPKDRKVPEASFNLVSTTSLRMMRRDIRAKLRNCVCESSQNRLIIVYNSYTCIYFYLRTWNSSHNARPWGRFTNIMTGHGGQLKVNCPSVCGDRYAPVRFSCAQAF
jgi:hypothetical protein